MGDRNYFDYNASAPLDERVLAAMLPFLKQHYANPSSSHQEGRLVRQAIEQAREQVAALVNAHPSQVIFTSGGTEANNLALKGVQLAQADARILVSAIEHESVFQPAKRLQARTLPVDAQGRLDMAALEAGLRQGAELVSVMSVNNETGVIQDIADIADKVRAQGALMHTDAVQALGKHPLDMPGLGVQMMTLSSHKIYGPKGVGALVVDKGVSFEPLLHGGAHEKGRRAGTENVAGIIGFGQAAELTAQEWQPRSRQLLQLREGLESSLTHAIEGVEIFSKEAERVSNTCFFSVPGIDGETLLLALDDAGFAVSSGSACGSKDTEPSHVLMAMGIETELARGAVRISLGKENTEQQVDALVRAVKQQVETMRQMACAW